MAKTLLLIAMVMIVFNGCSDEQNITKTAPSMKCGVGKCGGNMFNGNKVLAKKKQNILSQMRDDDTRKECVKSAKTTKELYGCIRDPKTHRLTKRCGDGRCGKDIKKAPLMKCGEGKCGVM